MKRSQALIKQPVWRLVDTGAGLIEIFAQGGENHVEGSVRHFALATDDPDACVKAVREAGYKITVEPNDLTIPAETPFPVRIAFAVGPCGETIEFFKEC